MRGSEKSLGAAAMAALLSLALGGCGRPEAPVRSAGSSEATTSELRVQHALIGFRSAAGWVGWSMPLSAQRRTAAQAQALVHGVRARVRQGESLREAVRAEGLVMTSSDSDHFCLDPSGRCEVEERRASVINFLPSGKHPQLSRRPDRSMHNTLERHASRLRPGELVWVPYDPVTSPHGHHLIMLAP